MADSITPTIPPVGIIPVTSKPPKTVKPAIASSTGPSTAQLSSEIRKLDTLIATNFMAYSSKIPTTITRKGDISTNIQKLNDIKTQIDVLIASINSTATAYAAA